MQDHFCNKNVVITGGGGFIGAHLIRDLVETPAKIYLLVDEQDIGWRIQEYIDQVEVRQVHDWNSNSLARLLESIEPDIIFHLRANIDRSDVNKLSEDRFDATLAETQALLEATRQVTGARFIHAGTVAEYGGSIPPFSESDTPYPPTTYGQMKLKASESVMALTACTDISVVVLRFSVVFGPYQNPHDYLIPNVIKQCLQGKDIKFKTSGSEKRDPLFVSDAINGLKRAATSDKSPGQIVNFGLGEVYSIKEIAEHINKMLGNRVNILTNTQTCLIEGRDVFQDIDKAKQMLSWEPLVDFKKGISATAKWYQENRTLLGLS
jgi:UDP-glucose 4-epimerase